MSLVKIQPQPIGIWSDMIWQELGINVEHIVLRMKGVALFKKLEEVVGARPRVRYSMTTVMMMMMVMMMVMMKWQVTSDITSFVWSPFPYLRDVQVSGTFNI